MIIILSQPYEENYGDNCAVFHGVRARCTKPVVIRPRAVRRRCLQAKALALEALSRDVDALAHAQRMPKSDPTDLRRLVASPTIDLSAVSHDASPAGRARSLTAGNFFTDEEEYEEEKAVIMMEASPRSAFVVSQRMRIVVCFESALGGTLHGFGPSIFITGMQATALEPLLICRMPCLVEPLIESRPSNLDGVFDRRRRATRGFCTRPKALPLAKRRKFAFVSFEVARRR